MERPACRVVDDLHPLAVHPHDGAVQVSPGARIGDVQFGVGRHVHERLRNIGAVAVASGGVAVRQTARGLARAGVAAADHRLGQLRAEQRAQAGETVLGRGGGGPVDDADLHPVAGEAVDVPDQSPMGPGAPTPDVAPVLERRRHLAHPLHPRLACQLAKQPRRHIDLEVVAHHIGGRHAVGGEELEHLVAIAVELHRQQQRLCAQRGVRAAGQGRRHRTAGGVGFRGTALGGEAIVGYRQRAELRAQIGVHHLGRRVPDTWIRGRRPARIQRRVRQQAVGCIVTGVRRL